MIKHSLQFPLTLKMLLFMAVSKIKDFSNPVEIWSPRTELEPQPDPIDILMVVGTDRVGIKKSKRNSVYYRGDWSNCR